MQTAFMPIFPTPGNQRAFVKRRTRALLTPPLWCSLSVVLCLGIALEAQQGIEPSQRTNGRFEGSLRIDTNLALSLARTGCAIHIDSNAAVPFAEALNLPAGPYRKVYRTKSGIRHFAIAGDDCDYFANPTGPTVRMVSLHRMDSGLIYVALFDARGDVLAFIEETPGHPPQYAPAKASDIETIYADFRSEVQSWNNALLKLLRDQIEQNEKVKGSGSR